MSRHRHEHEHEHEHCHDHTHPAVGGECDGEGHIHHHHEDGSCCCHHHEIRHHGMNKPQMIRLAISALLFFSHYFLEDFLHENTGFEIALFAAVTLIAGYDVIFSALKNIFSLKFFDEYFLMSFAAVAAFIIGNYHEAAAVMFLYRVGETLQDGAIRYSRRKIAAVTGSYGSLEDKGGKSARLISRFAKVYTPAVIACALLIALGLPLFTDCDFSASVYKALTFLVVACPCAVVISVPMSYFAGMAAGAARGIYFGGPDVMDALVRGRLREEDIGIQLVIKGGEEGRTLAQSIASKARLIAFENIALTVAVKLAVIVLSILGISSLWFAVFADSGVAILLTLNSLRAFIPRGRF